MFHWNRISFRKTMIFVDENNFIYNLKLEPSILCSDIACYYVRNRLKIIDEWVFCLHYQEERKSCQYLLYCLVEKTNKSKKTIIQRMIDRKHDCFLFVEPKSLNNGFSRRVQMDFEKEREFSTTQNFPFNALWTRKTKGSTKAVF